MINNLINKFKSNIKLMFIILASVILLGYIVSACSSFGSGLSLVGNVFGLLLNIGFFGLIIVMLILNKKEIYSILLYIFFGYWIYSTFANTFDGFMYFSSYSDALENIYYAFLTVYNLAAGGLLILTFYEIFSKKDASKITFILLLIALGALAVRFILYIILAIVEDYGWTGKGVFNNFLGIISNGIMLTAVFTKTFLLKDEEPKENKEAAPTAPKVKKAAAPKAEKPVEAPVEEKQEVVEEPVEEKLEENGVPQE